MEHGIDSADRPALEKDEIEITPEMIEAGVAAYRDRDSRFMRDRDIVEDIFISMALLAPRPKVLYNSCEDL
jgi:hypothetical protein